MKPSERISRAVNSHRLKGDRPQNVSSFVRDPEAAAYIGKLIEIIDELDARVRKYEKLPKLASAPRKMWSAAS